MRIIYAGLATIALCAQLCAQTFIPIGASSQIQVTTVPVLVTPVGPINLRLIAPGIYAEDDPAVGAAAYTACMLGVGATDLLCGTQRQSAWTADATKRWAVAFNALMAYKGGNGPTTDQILASQRLHWIPTS